MNNSMEGILASEVLFVESSPDANALHLTAKDLDVIGENLSLMQRYVHSAFRGPIRYNRQPISDAVVILTGLSVLGFVYEKFVPTRKKQVTQLVPSTTGKSKKGKPEMIEQVIEVEEPDTAHASMRLQLLFKFDLSSLDLIAYSKDKELLLRTPRDNVRLMNDGSKRNLELGQLTYRNYQVLFSVMDKSDVVEVKCEDMSLFPDIDLYFSPSQKFQFLYFGLCQRYNALYHQEVVRFVHSLVVTGSSIVDLSQIPIDLFGKYQSGFDLRPVFHALSLMDFVCGVCCSDTNRPNILEEMQFLMQKESKIKIVHLVNCKATTGMKQLESVIGRRNKSPVRYWNLRGNQFDDFGSFLNVLHFSNEPVILLDVSDCGIRAPQAGDLFQMFMDTPMLQQIQQLHIAGIELDTRAESNFKALMQQLHQSRQSKLDTLDLSRIEAGLSSLLQALIDFPQPLVNLKIADVKIQDSQSDKLIRIIRESKTLRSLDMSKTYINPESIVNVITAISQNDNLKNFEICLDELSLTTGNLLPIFRVFLEGNLKTWRSISLCRNEMTAEDLRNIIPLFVMMKKLRSLSLSGNFDSEMPGIGKVLPEILNIKSLKKLHIAGSDTKKLRKEIIPFIVAMKDHPNLTDIDISNNAIGDEGFVALLSCLKTRKLASLRADGSEISSIDLLSQLPKLLAECRSVSFEFPMKDSSIILKRFEGATLRDAVFRLTNLQLDITEVLAANRSKRHMIPKLPFQTTREIRSLIMDITQTSRKAFLQNEKPLLHSTICQEFGLPLPYQQVTDLVSDGGSVSKLKVAPDLKVYKSAFLSAQVSENPADYTAPDPSLVRIDSSDSDEGAESSDSEDDLMKSKKMRWTIVKENAKKSKENGESSHSHIEGTSSDIGSKQKDGKNADQEYSDKEVTHSKRKSHKKRHSISDASQESASSSKKRSGKKRTLDSESSDEDTPSKKRNSKKRMLDSESSDEGTSSKKRNRKKRMLESESSDEDASSKKRNQKIQDKSDSLSDDTPSPKKKGKTQTQVIKGRHGRHNSKHADSSSEEKLDRKTRASLAVKHKKLLTSSDSDDADPEKNRKKSGSRASSKKKLLQFSSSSNDEKSGSSKRKTGGRTVFSSSDEDPSPKKRKDSSYDLLKGLGLQSKGTKPTKKKSLFNLSSSSEEKEELVAPPKQPRHEKKKKLSSGSSDSDREIDRAPASGALDDLLDFTYKPEKRPKKHQEDHPKGPVNRKPAPRLEPIARLPDHKPGKK